MGTEIGRVRGLGSAGHGAQHWWHQKLTAGTNFLLIVWLLASIATLPSYDHGTVRLWLHSAWAAIPMALLIASVFYHFRLGLQVVIEDYSHKESRFVLTVLVNVFTLATAGTAIFSILKVAFGATA
ncbi:succinate dehydrogenase, hydrophobic membrane anchor protein [Sphingomonas endophytica]|uniref:Succinate dehydrogenase hydrophobic membrane anchor subunit n=1 Tax=Sphingomonas endophytica TaxID=869719 RepID=A0A7X0J9I2_9SPHN|nr:succinate dehydrogenase, hydrophobic membrane anchor protein [Sphingomonas endophytica]MBB5724477.1 succinate dehydrogenase / fumarate reductase membrane anchor subunit [Sphingomonas endophytica]MBB6503564.1 succinate dehydrogenase / fumarate reductase membrane anchor subunit [Sphingomonas endophytica]